MDGCLFVDAMPLRVRSVCSMLFLRCHCGLIERSVFHTRGAEHAHTSSHVAVALPVIADELIQIPIVDASSPSTSGARLVLLLSLIILQKRHSCR